MKISRINTKAYFTPAGCQRETCLQEITNTTCLQRPSGSPTTKLGDDKLAVIPAECKRESLTLFLDHPSPILERLNYYKFNSAGMSKSFQRFPSRSAQTRDLRENE